MTLTNHSPLNVTVRRLAWPDALRGTALLAILIANIPFQHAEGPRHFFGNEASDSFLLFLFQLLIDKKFIVIFSMLFGFGAYVVMQKRASRHLEFRSYFIIRMLLLFAVGCLHAYLIWFGDIIRYYALGGMILIAIFSWQPRKIFVFGSVVVSGAALMFVLNEALSLQQYTYDPSIVTELAITPSYIRYLEINFAIDPLVNFIQDSPRTLFFTIGSMIIGFGLAKTGLFHQPEGFQKVFNILIGIGLTVGLPCSYLFWMINNGTLELSLPLIWLPFFIVAGFVLQALAYLSLFAKAFHSAAFHRMLAPCIAVGRMSLTAYVLQSIFYIIFFFRWSGGLALYGKLNITETYALAFLLFSIELMCCNIWMTYFDQGPVEQLWKKLTNRLTRSN